MKALAQRRGSSTRIWSNGRGQPELLQLQAVLLCLLFPRNGHGGSSHCVHLRSTPPQVSGHNIWDAPKPRRGKRYLRCYAVCLLTCDRLDNRNDGIDDLRDRAMQIWLSCGLHGQCGQTDGCAHSPRCARHHCEAGRATSAPCRRLLSFYSLASALVLQLLLLYQSSAAFQKHHLPIAW